MDVSLQFPYDYYSWEKASLNPYLGVTNIVMFIGLSLVVKFSNDETLSLVLCNLFITYSFFIWKISQAKPGPFDLKIL